MFRSLCSLLGTHCRIYSSYSNQSPLSRTWKIISDEIPVFFTDKKKPIIYPEHADIVIIGGGFIGSAVAYAIKARAGKGVSVVVLEKDFSYQSAQQNTPLGTLSQHYSLPENIQLSQYTAQFLRNFKEVSEDIDIQFRPHGHLTLASEKYSDKLEQNVLLLKELGIKNELLTKEDIKNRFPWIDTSDLKLGCIGNESEGTFNAWALLKGLIFKSQELGTTYVNATVVGFETEVMKDVLMEGVAPGTFKKLTKVIYRTSDNEEYALKFAQCILTAGYDSNDISKLAEIGTGDFLLSIPLPVEPREHAVYTVDNLAERASLDTPHVQDTSGLWFKKNGLQNNFTCGHVPLKTIDSLELSDDEFLKNVIEPSLVNRLPMCKKSQITKASSTKYDHNTYDECGVLGMHPYHNNLIFATGFGKLGIEHAPGLGRAVCELIIDSDYKTVDMTRFGFDRFLINYPLTEFNIY